MAKTRCREVGAEFLLSAPRWDRCPEYGLPELVIAGRSNVGKSSFINFLLCKKNLARISSTPGRTQTPNLFRVDGRFVLVDLPGYGYAKAPVEIVRKWTENSKKFIAKRDSIVGVVQLMDIRRDPSEQDLDFFRMALRAGRPVVLVVTKADKVSRGARSERLERIAAPFDLDPSFLVPTSAKAGLGCGEVWEIIKELLAEAPALAVHDHESGESHD